MAKKIDLLEAYSCPNILLKERQRIFNNSWILACHMSELETIGDYLTLDIAGEPIVIWKGTDGKLNAFFNICVHRGFPLFLKSNGNVESTVQCEYHGWQYGSEGELVNPKFKSCSGLKKISMRELGGFIFVNINSNVDADGTIFKDFKDDFHYLRLDEHTPVRPKVFIDILPVNWKLFMENTLDGTHVQNVHPGLNELIGTKYKVDLKVYGARTTATINNEVPNTFSEKIYYNLQKRHGQKCLDSQKNNWSFYFFFPNTQISIYPEQVFYLQAFPIEPQKTLVRGRFLHLKNEQGRVNALMKYLNLRIGKKIYQEDLKILKNWQNAFKSRSLGEHDLFNCEDLTVAHFYDIWRKKIDSCIDFNNDQFIDSVSVGPKTS